MHPVAYRQAAEAAVAAAAAEQQQDVHSTQRQQQQPASGVGPGQQYSGGSVLNLDSHLAAKAVRPEGALGAGRKTGGADEDWGEDPLGDDLLPM